jgi:alpha-amylase
LVWAQAELDLWDLGEFDQKGTTRTKWGTMDDLNNLVKVSGEKNILIYFDAVLNHKAAADETEKCRAIRCLENGLRRAETELMARSHKDRG